MDAAPALSVSEPLWWGGEPSPHQLRAGEQIDARIAVAAACAAVSYCAHAAGYTPGAGSFNNACGRLRSLGLVDYREPGCVKAEPVLFLEGLE